MMLEIKNDDRRHGSTFWNKERIEIKKNIFVREDIDQRNNSKIKRSANSF